MTDTFNPHGNLDLTTLEDERLVAMAQEGSRAAEHALILRYLDSTSRHVSHLARSARLGAEDAADARQEALGFWMPLAIRDYRGVRFPNPNSCRFRSFKHQVIQARFHNFVRGLWRRARHEHPAEGANCTTRTLWISLPATSSDDPALIAERREILEWLPARLASLGPAARGLWEWMASSHSLRAWARERGMTFPQASSLWAAVRACLLARRIERRVG